MADVSNILELQQMVSTLIKQLQTEPVKDSNKSYSKECLQPVIYVLMQKQGTKKKSGFQADVLNIQELQDMLISPVKHSKQNQPFLFILSSYPQAGKNVLIKKRWMKIKITFELILAIFRSYKRCLLAKLTSSKDSFTAYLE